MTSSKSSNFVLHNEGAKKSRVELRVSTTQKHILQSAALNAGVDLTAFILSIALKEAERMKVRSLTLESWEKINSLINNPPEPTNELIALFKGKKHGYTINFT